MRGVLLLLFLLPSLLMAQISGGTYSANSGIVSSGNFTIVANYNNQSGGDTIPANWLGTNVSAIQSGNNAGSYDGTQGSDLNALPAAGLNLYRLTFNTNQNCPAGVCPVGAAWSSSIPAGQINELLTANPSAQILLYDVYTPTNLGTNACTPPSSGTTWASYIVSFLTYENGVHPGAIKAVELINEPDYGTVGGTTGQWCPATGTLLAAYTTLVQSAGPYIHSNAPAGTLVVAGVLGTVGDAATWFASTGIFSGGYMPDAVSYHFYKAASYSAWGTALSDMQNTSSGILYWYTQVQNDLKTVGFTGQLWITETAISYSYVANCCSNDPTYGPLWDVTNIINYLNARFTYGATKLPDHILRFTNESSTNYVPCLTGDSAGLCNNTTPPNTPQPSWYAYSLMNSLNLPAGGGTAYVTQQSTVSSIDCGGFYTTGGDALVCSNPTASVYTGTFMFLNPGSVSGTCTQYLLNATNEPVTHSSCSPVVLSNGYGIKMTIPAYSTVAAKIQ